MVFKAVLAVNLAWTVLLGIATLVTYGDGGNSCRAQGGPIVLWMLGEFLIAPPLLIAIGAGLVGRDRRHPSNGWLGLTALLLTMCVILIAVAIGRWTEPPRCVA